MLSYVKLGVLFLLISEIDALQTTKLQQCLLSLEKRGTVCRRQKNTGLENTGKAILTQGCTKPFGTPPIKSRHVALSK
ncbi:hypothetical protein RND81_10G231800 [Saponaria officinalis]|uniref:Secreted protein n=1 Tax=Saponaria officinalis TaxID=3572 RepID=A0AAW1I7R3_SAPOF